MNLPSNLFATAFEKQRLGLMLAILIGIMVYLGSMAMAAQAVLARTSLTWGHDLQSKMTIEIPAQPGEDPTLLEERALKAEDFLKLQKDVSNVNLLPQSETARLLKPWIDDEELLAALALPRLIDIEISNPDKAQLKTIETALTPIVGDVHLHRHEQGMNELMGFLKGLGALASFMLVLTGCALVVIFFIICRAAIAVQNKTIELLHTMGATENIVAIHFQNHIRRLAIPSALIGFVLAVLTVLGLALLLGSLGGLSLVSTVSWVTIAGVMALVPLVAVGLAIITARLSVLRLLRRLL